MQRIVRHVVGTVAFFLLMSFTFLALPMVGGREINVVPWWIVLAWIPVGFLVSLAAEHVVRSGRWESARGRWSPAILIVAGVAVALALDALVIGGINTWTVVRAVLWAGAFGLFIIVFPRIMSVPREN